MSRVRQQEQQLLGVWCHRMQEPDLCELLRQYHALLLGLHGPKGGTLLLQHSGGLDSFINSSSDLTKKVQPFHPCLKFINAVMAAQVSAYGSHGLYCGLLATSLLRELLLLTQDVPQAIIRDVADGLASTIITRCSEPASLLDLSNLHQMLSFLSPCLDSKSLGLNDAERDHLRATVLEAFLMSVSDAGDARAFGNIAVTVAPGRPPLEASAHKGLLYRHHRFSELSMSRIIDKLESSHVPCKMNAQTAGINTAGRYVFSSHGRLNEPLLQRCSISKGIPQSKMFSRYSHNSFSDLRESSIRLLLFNVMLEFTTNKTERTKFVGSSSSSNVFDSEVCKKLCRFIKQEGIDVLACQKVVSEGITLELERFGVLVLERLGTSLTASLEKLSCCRPLSDLSLLDTDLQPCSGSGHTHCNCPLQGTIGRIDSLQRLCQPGGLYLLLQNSAPLLPVVTLLLPALSSHVAESLKVLVEQTLRSVRQTTLSPGVVCSRCWGAALAAVVQQQDVRAALLKETTATEVQVSLVVDAFWRVLVRISDHKGVHDSPQLSPIPPPPVWAQGRAAVQRPGKEVDGDPKQRQNQGVPESTPSCSPRTCPSYSCATRDCASATVEMYSAATPESFTSATFASCTAAPPASCTSATPASCASATPASSTPATSASSTSATLASSTSATPASSTSATPASYTSATPASSTPVTPAYSTSATPASCTSTTPASCTSATPASRTSATPASSTPVTPASSTSATPASSTSAMPASCTSATPASSTPVTPASSTSATPASCTSATPASCTSARPVSCTSATPASCTSATPASCTPAASAVCSAAGCLLESHAAAFSAISSALETALQLLQVDYCIFDR